MKEQVNVSELMQSSGVKFGTSGARGLVSALTDRVAYAYTAAFLQHLERSGALLPKARVAVAGDLRASTPRIVRAVLQAATDRGCVAEYAGTIPSPALALYALAQGIPAVMVTGSHIPDDRNGIKFNTEHGEILKADEIAIAEQVVELPDCFDAQGNLSHASAKLPLEANAAAEQHYVRRWIDAFPAGVLAGKTVAVYGHSAVGRDLLVDIVQRLGARVLRLGWSERFVSVDTEAIRAEDVELAAGWAANQPFFALLSTDGDSDRPLIADESGKFVRGDICGVLVARYFAATCVAAPVSCNSVLELCGWFPEVVRTKIGSPYVIEAMSQAAQRGEARAVGYEANGGFMHATPLRVPGGDELSPLPTRDAVIVHLALLCDAVRRGLPLSQLTAELPQRFTASDRLADFPTQLSAQRIAELTSGGASAVSRAFPELGLSAQLDTTDGLRITFQSGDVLHVRPSGNAPELRCYVEAGAEERARRLLDYALSSLASWR